MKLPCIILLCLLLTFDLSAQHDRDSVALPRYEVIKQYLSGGLRYLENTQRRETIVGHQYSGEWPVRMYLKSNFILLGTESKVEDSNCFSVASTHNALAEIYLRFPEYDNILPMLDLSFERIMGYRNGDKFNFWNLLPPRRKLRGKDIVGKQPYVRRPTNFDLDSRFINNAANVVEDADDTGLAYAAIALRNEYAEEIADSLDVDTISVAEIFDPYRDSGRENRHWFNQLNGIPRETGAWLTWLAEEHTYRHWSTFKTIFNNAFFYLPFSINYPHPYIPYIPYGTNDIDAVVNANILMTLSLYDELDAKGKPAAVNLIESLCKKGKFDRVGIYYPNRYQFPYAVCKAYNFGVTELQPSTELLLAFLLESQNPDGSWQSRKVVSKGDILQSTAYALNALLYIGDYTKNGTIAPIERAIDYILDAAKNNANGTHWKGGVFFSGGTVVRNTLFWESDAYTTAIILTGLANYRAHLEHKWKDDH